MNYCKDKRNRPLCFDCTNRSKDRGKFTNEVNAGICSIYCAECGKEILSVQQCVEARKAGRRKA